MRNALALPALLALASCAAAASQIALFTDTNCQDSFKGLEGPNGYPNGSCTDFRRSGTYGSLQVVGLDAGCGVTIYMADPDTTICGGFQEEIQLGDCWNSTFAYYSIDMCDPPSSTSSSTATATATSTSTSTPSASGSGTPRALIGGLAGGLGAALVLLLLALWLLARRKRARKAAAQAADAQRGDYAEVALTPARSEMGAPPRYEMGGAGAKGVWAHRAAEVEQPVAELGGTGVERHELGRGEGRA
ncbi:hypothetical protein C7974DRAFT_472440 [Boeremia exigua]|uniref:uncharacterized protein n=1 Tax=Boeremia exigua TaxID=749465 RepID=UPI001E8ED7A6|nr:uncharacterized protein C7974DRAFT_472440 [Boeremia exigua]KAH6629716.1 hypothetical protein C7974DRAFT_472440 [Boeremia exigua]